MNQDRARYRARQFFLALRASVRPVELAQVQAFLPPAQMALFAAMHASEQAHALSVYHQLVDQGATSPDLLTAALLHDVGKSRCPLRLWERILVVLAKAVFPVCAKRWGSSPPREAGCRGWKRAFVIAEQHPAWGADLAEGAGASVLAVALIRQHQDPASRVAGPELERLLIRLQAVDDLH